MTSSYISRREFLGTSAAAAAAASAWAGANLYAAGAQANRRPERHDQHGLDRLRGTAAETR